MSRTDKDRPYWVASYDTTQRRIAIHYCYRSYIRGECDINKTPRNEDEYMELNCVYRTIKQHGGYYCNDTPDSDYIKFFHRRPERQRERLGLWDAKKQYRADPEAFNEDYDFANFQEKNDYRD